MCLILDSFKASAKRAALAIAKDAKGLAEFQRGPLTYYILSLKMRLMLEKVQSRVILEYQSAVTQIDPLTDGLRVEPTEGRLPDLVSRTRTVITQNRLNSKQVY